MQRLQSIQPETAQGRTRQLFDQVQQTLGGIPNTTRVMANSPAVLESFLAFAGAMNNASIGKKLHHQIKLGASETNSCDYCTSILCAVAPDAGLTAEDILAGRTSESDDARTSVALKFAETVLENRGKISPEQIESVRNAGFDDGQIVEIIASVVLGCFTNFLNNAADTELDIPKAETVAACSADAGCGCAV